MCRLIEDGFAWLCAHKFGGGGEQLPNAPPIAPVSPVLPEPGPDDPEQGFHTEKAAMEKAMELSLQEKDAGCTSSSGLREEFKDSVLLQELAWEDRLGTGGALDAMRQLLGLERKCQKWWKHESGVPGYFRDRATAVTAVSSGVYT
jgi:hypothetical protein